MSSPSPSKALGNVAPASAANAVAWSRPSLLTTPTTCTCPPAVSDSCCISGSSSRQGPHQLAHRFTTVGTPGARPRSSVPPPRQSNVSGGGSAGPAPRGPRRRGAGRGGVRLLGARQQVAGGVGRVVPPAGEGRRDVPGAAAGQDPGEDE